MMVEDKNFKAGEDHYMYVKFSAEQPLDCLKLYRFVRKFFPYQMDIVFDRLEHRKSHTLSGYFRLPSGTMRLSKIAVDGVQIHLDLVNKTKFDWSLKSLPAGVFFSGFPKSTSIEDMKQFFKKHGKLRSLTLWGLTQGSDGMEEHRGHAIYSSAIDSEKLLAKGQWFKFKGRQLFVESYTKKEVQQIISRESRYKSQTYYCESSDEESEESFYSGQGRIPKLDFNSKNPATLKTHAFGGYFIRPYMRSVGLVKQNVADSLNIRINILAPRQPALATAKHFVGSCDEANPAKLSGSNTAGKK